jgi:DNA repair exonuclease SbcCD ATPase subunit
MSLIIKTLRYKNFLSTGDEFTTFDFTKHASTLITGKNGSGKSTFIDALIFGLYGKAYRKINKPQLVNTINNKNLIVEVEMMTNNRNYLIRRGIKPNIFEVYQDGNLLNQDAKIKDYQVNLEENILKIGFRAFTQIVVLGSAQHVPFMQLTTQARREIIEDLLDLQIFSIMNSILKERIAYFKQEFEENKMDIKLIENKLELTSRYLRELEENFQHTIQSRKDEIEELKEQKKEIETLVEEVRDEILKIESKLAMSAALDVSKKMDVISEKIADKKSELRKITSQTKFFETHTTCPTCEHDLEKEFIDDKLATLNEDNKRINELLGELQGTQERIREAQRKLESITSALVTLIEKQRGYDQRAIEIERRIGRISDEIEGLQIKKQEQSSSIGDISQLNTSRSLLLDKKKDLLERKDVYAAAAYLLKEGGIKSRIIRQYIPIMNKLISKYLAEMDFYIQFELDEDFNETILSRYRDSFSYDSFSEGEKFRIDLALLFTWRAIAKLRNSTTCNLLILDEIFDSSLDAAGTDEFLKIMDALSDNTNVYIISHRLDTMADKFENLITFTKEKNFSKMSKEQ